VSQRTLRHRAEYAALALARGLTSRVPERFALGGGALLGRAVGDVTRVRRADVEMHLRTAFPESSPPWRKRVARACYAHFGREAAVLLRADGWSRELVRERTRVVGFEHFRDAARSGRGVVLLTGHLGNWELGGAAIAARGVPLDVVGKGMSNRRFQSDLFALRAGLGMRVLEMGDAPREALHALGEGRVVALLADQRPREGGVLVPFFGKPAATARGPALFALRSGAWAFVAFCVAEEPGAEARYTVTFAPLAFAPCGRLDEDVKGFLGAYAGALEGAVRAVPHQYFWQHRRWKRAPGDALAAAPANPPEPPSAG
jgi:KDO2-lipid IV(A) lauroyltransferase